MVQRSENTTQAAAFEQYYLLGDNRSLVKLHQQRDQLAPNSSSLPSLRTLKNWSQWFNWQQRVSLKDKAIAEGVNKKTTKEAISLRAKWLKQTEARISTAFDSNGKPKFDIKDSRSLNETVRLALMLLGEPEKESKLNIEQIRIVRVMSVGNEKE